MTRVFVAAGSNVDAERNLRLAARELVQTFGKVDFSPAYRNVAAGFEGDDFINFVAAFDTERPVREVIGAVERVNGANLPVTYGPRRAGDPAAIVAGASRIREVLGWQPQYQNLDFIVETALNWERKLAQRNGGQAS